VGGDEVKRYELKIDSPDRWRFVRYALEMLLGLAMVAYGGHLLLK
jgi:hypothetical protein